MYFELMFGLFFGCFVVSRQMFVGRDLDVCDGFSRMQRGHFVCCTNYDQVSTGWWSFDKG